MIPLNEGSRLNALMQLELLDTAPSEVFDRVTRMAAQLFDLPIALISLTDTDRQWFKSRVGIDDESIKRKGAPCSDVAETRTAVVVEDVADSPLYQAGPLGRSGVRFYAGAPLITHQGFGIGALCVLGMHPRKVTDRELAALGDLADMVMAQVEMQHAIGRVDPMSGMPNRNQFLEDIADMARDQPGALRMAVLVEIAGGEEMDQAAQVMGTRYFDEVVQAAAETIRSIIGPNRPLYHVAATQFVFMAPAGANPFDYAILLRSRTKAQHETLTNAFLLSPRIGVSQFDLGSIRPREVLRRAHAAAQSARVGGETVRFYSIEDNQANTRSYWVLNEFKNALAGHQLHLVYQPRIDLGSGYCVGSEALVRWTHPVGGAISPAEFVPLIEGTRHIRALTEWVVETAFAQLAAWRVEGSEIQLSLNVSPMNLEDPDFVPMIEAALARHGLPADRIELELTEGAVMQKGGNALGMLRALSATGFRLAIDDFGTGYSSLSYLQLLPVDVVKIDRSFLVDLAANPRNLTLLRAMIPLCRDLGYRVVAEGVEDECTRDMLRDAGCDEAQGYFFGKPMLPKALGEFLTADRLVVL